MIDSMELENYIELLVYLVNLDLSFVQECRLVARIRFLTFQYENKLISIQKREEKKRRTSPPHIEAAIGNSTKFGDFRIMTNYLSLYLSYL